MSRPRLVLKFGGTSVGTPERIESAAARVLDAHRSGVDVAVVVSAMAGETDRLLALARRLGGSQANSRELDVVASSGEQVSAGLMSLALEARGMRARSFLAHQIPIRTDATFGNATISEVNAAPLLDAIDRGIVPVIAGFQGVSGRGDVTTLGRGGSDTTAVAVAATLHAACDIYTDVDGVYTIDPRVSSAAARLPVIGYQTMHALAAAGAKVLETRSVALAERHRVVVHVRNAMSTETGTHVVDDATAGDVVGVALRRSTDGGAHVTARSSSAS